MARKKKKPHRSIGISEKNDKLDNPDESSTNDLKASEEVEDKPYFVPVDRVGWDASEHRDLSEIALVDLNIMQEFIGYELTEEFYQDSSCNLRFRLSDVIEHANRLDIGKWPIFSSGQVYLELGQTRLSNGEETCDVIVSGSFDGPDDGVSGLVHLASMRFLTLRPVLGVKLMNDTSSLRLRVEILENAFDACESILESSKQLWKKSMMNVMAWLRPEVTTSEAKYGVGLSSDMEFDTEVEGADKKDVRFEVAGFYEAIKPPKNYPMLEDELPNLIPELRPYQRRAVQWMAERERKASGVLESHQNSPLCLAVELLDSSSYIFYNPFSGSFSIHPESPSSHVFGGILADEMGLGKTVELLGCVFSHQRSASEASCFSENGFGENIGLKRVKMDRVECVCGAVSESVKYKGLWVQCDICDAWQHGDCVDYSASGTQEKSKEAFSEPTKKNNKRKRSAADIVVTNGEFICRLCLELIQVTKSPVVSGATLIVCPTPILSQWHAEIIRHTVSGSLTTVIYEGMREPSRSESHALSVGELVVADIVLTTYDILKADLSHDSERHEGDRRLMRYEKRYPVIPTPLTRIFWWRVCLDEAQMVESSTAAATEMALRLHAKYRWCITGTPIQSKLDDLYGLLRFLKASPFDVLRWWTDIIREPYERGDPRAMEFTHCLFRQLMWRSSKESVADELKLPPQEECLSWLSFSAVEEVFYQRQHESCVTIAHEVLRSLKTDIHKRNDDGDASDIVIIHLEASKLLNSLLKLRQACCHPQVGSSGLCSIQQSPMSMDEILSVLVSKTKVEGEDALRKVVSSLNGLAGIAIIRSELSDAMQLYKEALALAEEHSGEFRLDPLLNLHIHYNLAEILTSSGHNLSPKRNKHITRERDTIKEGISDKKANDFRGDQECDMEPDVQGRTYSNENLLKECENIKEKYLFAFYSRLSQAQQDFQKSYTQVCDAYKNKKHQETWWLEALHQIKQDKETLNELTSKIENAVLRSRDVSKSSRSAPHLRSIISLEYHLQTGLDSLEKSRKILFDRLLKVDQTMDHPRDEDVERIRFCPKCYDNMDGPLCVHCEMDDLFEDYEARLFLLKRDANGRNVVSTEEAINLHRQKSEFNQFLGNLPENTKTNLAAGAKKREFGKKLEVSRMPSELEIILGVLRSYFKSQLGREGTSAATKHLLLLESMRKEYPLARSLATAQAQIFRAHDEIKMATSRLRLRHKADDNSIDAISLEELDIASVENSSEKFVALASLTRIRGKLRYLQGLVRSKQKTEAEQDEEDAPQVLPRTPSENDTKVNYEVCPVCQEKLLNQRMVFECGHATCCKCLFAMTAQRRATPVKLKKKWVMCPTCRQHSDFENVAFADDGRLRSTDVSCNSFDASIRVRGSYGTKIEAVTRRILWIKLKEPEAKVLVFSSWNDVLNVLEHAFATNQISYVRMKGGRKSQAAISIFKGQKSANSVQVLLILVQHGANGLNLLEAQHVILVEPLLNPGAEAQAISRVHRIGQNKKTLIHRFMVKGSVEESIFKLNKSRNANAFVSCNKKNQDQPLLTLKDIESLFSNVACSMKSDSELKEEGSGSLNHLPPSVAAAIAAERRLSECSRTLDTNDSNEDQIRADNELG